MHSTKTIGTPKPNKTILRFIQVVLFGCLHFLPGLSHALDICDLSSYGGLEYVHRKLVFQAGYGKGEFRQFLPQANAFLGVQLNNYFGLEFGYLLSQARNRSSLAIGGNQSFGLLVKEEEFIISENKINLYGPHINVLGRLPLGTCGFSLIGSLAVSSLTLKAGYKPLAYQLEILPEEDVIESKRSFSSKKYVPSLMAGLGYQFTNCIGIRALIGYEQTKKFKNIAPKEVSPIKISLKNNILGSIGFIARF